MTFIKSLELLSDFRAKLKHVLWLGDPKALESNSLEKLIYKTPSN